MLKLLLDVHLPAEVAEQVARHRPGCDIVHVSRWREGEFRTAHDELLLRAAAGEGRTLVTYDGDTVPHHVSQLFAVGESHAGVLYVVAKKIRQDDIGGLVRALLALWDNAELREADWTDREAYL